MSPRTAANQAALVAAGVPQSAFVPSIPTSQKVNFFMDVSPGIGQAA